MAFADDLMALADKIENLVVGTLTTNWKAASPIPIPGLYADPVKTREHFGIHEAFQPWSLLPDPDAFTSISDSLLQAMGMLRVDAEFTNPVNPSDVLGFARQEYQALVGPSPIDSWTGAAAENFRGNFLGHFRANTENQAILIAVLKAAAEAHSSVWAGARQDITSIATQTLAGLQNDGCDQSSWVMVFSVLAGLASIAAIPLSGPAAAIGMSKAAQAVQWSVAAIGATSSMATNAIPAMKSKDSASYQANSIEDAVTAMKSAIAALQERVDAGLVSIESPLLGNLMSFERGNAKQDLFLMAKPTLTTDNPDFVAGR